MAHDNWRQSGKGPHGGRAGEERSTLDTSGIKLKPVEGKALDPDLFDTVARRTADTIAENKHGNKPAQIRQFYEELVMWEERARLEPGRFDEFLPFIRMLNAKAAYASGRKHVDQNFVALIAHCLRQVSDAETLRNFKLFFEAFLGFYKLVGPKG